MHTHVRAHTPVLDHGLHHRDGVVFEVVVHLNQSHSKVLICRLMHCLLEVAMKQQHLGGGAGRGSMGERGTGKGSMGGEWGREG